MSPIVHEMFVGVWTVSLACQQIIFSYGRLPVSSRSANLLPISSRSVGFRCYSIAKEGGRPGSTAIYPPHSQPEPYDTLLYCPTSCPYRSLCGTDAACSSNTIRDSISRVAPSQRGPRSAPALRHARRPCALTRGRPTVPRRPGTGRSRRTARRAALALAVLRFTP
jgi:hypothetical protein